MPSTPTGALPRTVERTTSSSLSLPQPQSRCCPICAPTTPIAGFNLSCGVLSSYLAAQSNGEDGIPGLETIALVPCTEMMRSENERGRQPSAGPCPVAQSMLGCWEDMLWKKCSDCAFRLDNTTREDSGTDDFSDKEDEGELRANEAQNQADAWCISRVVGGIDRE
jgi:hypothetical protein